MNTAEQEAKPRPRCHGLYRAPDRPKPAASEWPSAEHLAAELERGRISGSALKIAALRKRIEALLPVLLITVYCSLITSGFAAEPPPTAPRTKAASHALRQRRLAAQPQMAMHGLASPAIVIAPPKVVTLVWSNPPNQLTIYNTIWRSDHLPVFTAIWTGTATNLVDAPGSNTFWTVSASYLPSVP